MPRHVIVLPGRGKPMPCRRLRQDLARCCRVEAVHLHDSYRACEVEDLHDLAILVQSNSANSRGMLHERVRLTEPNKQEPYGGSGLFTALPSHETIGK